MRGYDERAANGSQDFLASLELRSPTVSPLRDFAGIDDQGQALAFWDCGEVAYRNLQPAGPARPNCKAPASACATASGRFVDMRFDHGWQLERLPVAGARLGNLATLSVTLGY